jgi:hypothetical protein
MRVMVLVKGTEESEKGFLPTAETRQMLDAMEKFNNELREAGKANCIRRQFPQGHRRAIRPAPRAGRGLLALASKGYGRSRRLGEALSQSYAGTERDRTTPNI